MQYNIAAILRKDAFTVQAVFPGSDNRYTYVTNDKSLKVNDFAVVIVPNGAMKIVKIVEIDKGCVFPRELDTDYKWLVSKIDMTAYEENKRINDELVQVVEDARREHFRRQVTEKLLNDLPPETQKLLESKLNQISE